MASASGTSGSAWVSSLGNTFGGAATTTTGANASSASATPFGNPFSNANITASAFAKPIEPSQIGSKEDKNSMMAAFSDMGLVIDANASTTTAAAVAASSSSKALLAKKETERQLEHQAEAEQHARRQARLAAEKSKSQAAPASALMQAIDAFAGEVSQSDTFSSALGSRKTSTNPSTLAGGARRMRQKQDKAQEKTHARGGKSMRDVKRHQRREQYRHVGYFPKPVVLFAAFPATSIKSRRSPMDREQTPLKQRQKRGAARHANANNANVNAASLVAGGGGGSGGSERAFRSSGISQRGRAKVSTPDKSPSPAAMLAKPPLTILRAPPLGPSLPSGGGSYPPSHLPVAPVAIKTLYSPPPPPSSSHAHQHRNSVLRINTASSSSPSAASLSPSPVAATNVPQPPLRKPSTPGGGSHALPPTALPRPSLAAPLPPLVSVPPSATKLITASFQFASDIPKRLASCLELTNFTVIGALGFEGTGKSTLLSLLARLAYSSASASAAEETFDSMAAFRDRTTNPHFLAQRLETQLAGLQETQGVDLAVACEVPRLRANTGGLVLLDTQPLLSASHLAEVLARTDASPAAAAAAARYGALTPEQQHEFASVQMAVLLLSVCHYVIVPVRGDAAVDLEMVALLRKVHGKMQQSRLPNVGGHVAKDKHHAQLLFVANEAASYASPSVNSDNAMRALAHVLPQEWIYRQEPSGDLPLWTFTTLDATASPHDVDHWRTHAFEWARFVASLPASPSFTTKGPTTTTSMSASPLTLKEWLSNTARVWESVKRSSALAEEYTTRDHY